MENMEFQEDNASDEEFEKKMRESYQVHKDLSKSVSSSRPETAPRYRDDHERQGLIMPFQVYGKISSFLASLKVSKFLLSQHLGQYPSFQKFISGFEELGLVLTEEEVGILFKDNGSNKTGVVRMTDLYTKIIFEEDEFQDSEQQRLKEEIEKMLGEPMVKVRQRSEKNLKRPATGTYRSGSASTKAIRPVTAVAKPFTVRKNYLMESRAKIANADKEIALTVDRCKKEFEYECLHKMGEANEIAQAYEMPSTYRAVKKEDGSTKCHIYMNDHFVEEITLENFLREWRKLKRKQKPAINLQTTFGKTEKSAGKVNKKVRQEELKRLLLETKELTNKLKDQLKILEKRGVVANSIHSSTVVYSNNLF